MSYPSTVLADTPYSYWRMGASGGTTETDQTGNGHTLTYGNSPTFSQTGAIANDSDTAVKFVAASSNYASAALDLSSTKTVTVEAWLKSTVIGVAQNDPLAWEYGTNSFSGEGFMLDLGITFGGGNSGVEVRNTGNVNVDDQYTAGGGHGWETGFHHWVVIYDRTLSSPQQKVYVDGVQSTPWTVNHTASNTNNFTALTLYLASRAGSSLFCDVTLDEVAVYTYALSAAQITAHYNAGRGIIAVDVGLNSGPTLLGTSPATVYTPPSPLQMRELRIVNTLSKAVTVNVSWGADSVATRWLSGYSIPGNDAYEWSGLHWVPAGTQLQASCSDANACDIYINGILQG